MRRGVWHRTLLLREARAGQVQLLLFMFCVLLATVAVAVVAGWRASVTDAMAAENKKSAGGDVVAFSTEPFSQGLLEAIEEYHPIRTTEMFTVALAPGTDLSLFSKLKAVEPGYPLYGELPVGSGGNVEQLLRRGVLVEPRVLERLGISVGDELKVGSQTFEIVDVVLQEPDRPLGMFGVSPRIFIAHDLLESTGLLRPGSRLERRLHLRLADTDQADDVADLLRQSAVPDQERVESWERPPVSMQRFVENFFSFLDMLAVLATALGGLGMQSTLSTWLSSRRKPIAVMKTLGANRAFVFRHYGALIVVIASLGLTLGLSFAALTLKLSGDYLSTFLPVQVAPALTLGSALFSALLCLTVVGVFSFWPLRSVSEVRPGIVLRQEALPLAWGSGLRQSGCVALTLLLLLTGLTGDPFRSTWLTLGLLSLFALNAFFAWQGVAWARRSRPGNLALRTALGSWRDPQSKTVGVVFVLSTCVTILFSLTMLERALRQNWLAAMPPDVPNLLFLDISPHEWEPFQQFVGLPMEATKTMRARAQAVDGVPIDRTAKREYWERDARRELDASPTLELPPTDHLVAGASLYQGDDPHQVSLRDDVAEALQAKIGSVVAFTIQGVPVEATVSSIRHCRRVGFRPRFELLFPPELVEGAPQRMFARLRLDEEKVSALQTRVAKAYPGVVSMDVSLTIRLIGERLFQMVGLVRYFLLAGLLAGSVILASALWSTRWERRRESAYLKVLGADRRFVGRVLLFENLTMGALCSSLSFVLAVLISWALCRFSLDVPFPDISDMVALMMSLPTVMIAILGWSLSRGALDAKPALFLKNSD